MSSFKQQTKYASLATEMLVTLLLAFFAGNWLDKKIQFKFPLFTVLFCCIAIIVILVKMIKDNTPSSK